jgi:hypothetical protein
MINKLLTIFSNTAPNPAKKESETYDEPRTYDQNYSPYGR